MEWNSIFDGGGKPLYIYVGEIHDSLRVWELSRTIASETRIKSGPIPDTHRKQIHRHVKNIYKTFDQLQELLSGGISSHQHESLDLTWTIAALQSAEDTFSREVVSLEKTYGLRIRTPKHKEIITKGEHVLRALAPFFTGFKSGKIRNAFSKRLDIYGLDYNDYAIEIIEKRAELLPALDALKLFVKYIKDQKELHLSLKVDFPNIDVTKLEVRNRITRAHEKFKKLIAI